MVAPLWVGARAGNFTVGRRGFTPQAIVIHIMAGTMQSTRNWFNNPAATVSAHYGVGRDGSIEQYVHENDTAHHAGIVDRPSWPLLKPGVNPNYYTIGVEHEGTGAETSWPDAQLAASRALAVIIARRWNIPLDADHIVLHHQIRFGKTCPGEHFDKANYLAGLPRIVEEVILSAEAREVHATTAANLRSAPSSASVKVGQLEIGAAFAAVRTVVGEAVKGNNRWFRGADGKYLWAGATDRPL